MITCRMVYLHHKNFVFVGSSALPTLGQKTVLVYWYSPQTQVQVQRHVVHLYLHIVVLCEDRDHLSLLRVLNCGFLISHLPRARDSSD